MVIGGTSDITPLGSISTESAVQKDYLWLEMCLMSGKLPMVSDFDSHYEIKQQVKFIKWLSNHSNEREHGLMSDYYCSTLTDLMIVAFKLQSVDVQSAPLKE